MTLQPPAQFLYCQNDACPRAGECLRHRAYLALAAAADVITVLSPHRYGSCGRFLPAEPVRAAWGIRNMLVALPYQPAKNIKADLLRTFGRTRYYRFFREELPLMPEDQAKVREAFLANGIGAEPSYARFTEEYRWN